MGLRLNDVKAVMVNLPNDEALSFISSVCQSDRIIPGLLMQAHLILRVAICLFLLFSVTVENDTCDGMEEEKDKVEDNSCSHCAC